MMVPVLNDKVKNQIESIKELVLSEVNVKELEFMNSDSGILVKENPTSNLYPKFGQHMKSISQAISQFSSEDISTIEQEESYTLNIEARNKIELNDVITTEDVSAGWLRL